MAPFILVLDLFAVIASGFREVIRVILNAQIERDWDAILGLFQVLCIKFWCHCAFLT